LLTDYGYADEFAGVVRAVVRRHVPDAPIVDITHGVVPFDVRAGALALCRVVGHLGPGVVLGVVDPGVGTARRAIAATVRVGEDDRLPYAFVGPDNGLLPWAIDAVGGIAETVVLASGGGDGATFDGRDVFAPAAARLWEGAPLGDLGDPVEPADLVRLDPPRCDVVLGRLDAEVQWVDRFGNVQLAARADDARRAGFGDELDIEAVGRHRARRVHGFAELAPGALGVMLDANGHLALVCDRASAATLLGVGNGDVVAVRARAGVVS
jgi:hypothetical protein